jgi:ubiquitin carboxyl-terminal hydrolase 5/13
MPFNYVEIRLTLTSSLLLRYTHLATFPDYLVIQLKKFCMGEDWTPKKLDVSVDMPLELDLSVLRGKGKQPQEMELPEDDSPSGAVQTPQQQQQPSLDEGVVSQLMEMGFHPNACRRAVLASGNTGAESAMGWIMEHMDDPGLNEPLPQPNNCANTTTTASAFIPDEAAVGSIQAMGFTPSQAKKALRNTDNNVERAIDWIFSHPDELDTPDEVVVVVDNANNKPKNSTNKPPGLTDGPASESSFVFEIRLSIVMC